MNTEALSRMERLNYVLTALATLGVSLFAPMPAILGCLVGGLLSSLNFSVIRRVIEKMLAAQADHRGKVMLLLVPKMLALMAAITLAIVFLPINPIFLAMGFSVFVISIVVVMMFSTWQNSSGNGPGTSQSGDTPMPPHDNPADPSASSKATFHG